jgi:tRNA threonylcarbamoyladenosine biosynthesis protein TsaE
MPPPLAVGSSFSSSKHMSKGNVVVVNDEAGTGKLGQWLGRRLFPGAVVGLVGPLGAGKTHLVRAMALGLDIADPRMVASPTFVLIHEYPARIPIYHFDAYRLESVEEFFDLGVHEYFQGQGVCLVEWADKVEKCMPPKCLWIQIAITGPTSRQFTVEAGGKEYECLVPDEGEFSD